MVVPIAGCLCCVNGCFKAKTVLKVAPDGSGRITESIGMSKATIQQIEFIVSGFAQGMGAEKPEGGLMDEGSFKGKTANYGPGVKFLGSKKSEKGAMVTTTAEYAVADVSKIKLAPSNSPDVPGPGDGGKKKEQPFKFSLRKLPGGLSELKIHVPPPKPIKDEGNAADGGRETPPTAGDQDLPPEVVDMFKEVEMSISLECGKEIVETNATHVKGNRITLVQFSFAKLMEDQETLMALQKLGPESQSLQAIKPLLKDIEGIKFELEPTVVVKFR